MLHCVDALVKRLLHSRSNQLNQQGIFAVVGRMRLDVTFGERLRLWRAVRDLSQAELARRAGIEKATVNYAESGKRVPQSGTLNHIAGVLEVPLSALQDDLACFRELARIMNVSLVEAAGLPSRDEHISSGEFTGDEDDEQGATKGELRQILRRMEQLERSGQPRPPPHRPTPKAPPDKRK